MLSLLPSYKDETHSVNIQILVSKNSTITHDTVVNKTFIANILMIIVLKQYKHNVSSFSVRRLSVGVLRH